MWDMMLGDYTLAKGDDGSGGGWWMKVLFAADRRRITLIYIIIKYYIYKLKLQKYKFIDTKNEKKN